MSKKVSCTHCHLEFDKSMMIHEGTHYFCCSGCQGVYNLLNDEGLQSFYDKAGATILTAPTHTLDDSSLFDTEAFHDRYVKIDEDGFKKISLIIEGIHCSACVWLNEKALHKMDGVIEADINFTNNKATIIWAQDVVSLSQIIDTIRSIGYNAFAYDASSQESHANKERKSYYLRMAVAIFASMNIMWIAVAQYAGYFTGITQDVKNILNIAEWLLSTPVLFYSGWIFFRGAYFGLKTKTVNMDLLVATGATLTYIYSLFIMFTQEGEAYFDSVSMIITFVLIGKFLEILSKKNIVDALDIISKNIANEVKVYKQKTILLTKIDDVRVGDTIVLTSGERVLFDGEILKGNGYFDESSLTGESKPIEKQVGDSVISGTLSIDADVHYRATKDFEHSTLSNLLTLLESAINKKPKIQQIANKLSEYFSSVILLLSVVTFFVWWFWPHSFGVSFMVGISVIVIACPCALALATPVATLVGLTQGAKRGILFKEAAQLETMAKIDTLVLDKTGTLTVGRPEVINVHTFEAFDKQILYSLVSQSNHPVSKGIKNYLELEHTFKTQVFDSYEQISSLGIVATLHDLKILGGNEELLKQNNIEFSIVSDASLFYFVINSKVVVAYELNDQIKENAKEVISSIKAKSIDVVILSGDNEEIAFKVASEVGIDTVYSGQTPQDKSKYISSLHEKGSKVVMVGDGVNDILALARADISIVMGSGSDIAIDIGDVVLLDDSLTSLLDAFHISHRTYSLIKQNLGISLVYNAITIPLAMAGLVIPLVAAISMSVSSLLVVFNSMRIKWKL